MLESFHNVLLAYNSKRNSFRLVDLFTCIICISYFMNTYGKSKYIAPIFWNHIKIFISVPYSIVPKYDESRM